MYRCLYGGAFIRESIEAVSTVAERVYVQVAERPWGGVDGYLEDDFDGVPIPGGRRLAWPDRFDDLVERVSETGATLYRRDHGHPHDSFGRAARDIVRQPDVWIFVEPDHVWDPEVLEAALGQFVGSGWPCAYAPMIELWRRLDYAIPERPYRVGPVFWRGPVPETLCHGASASSPTPPLQHRCHNVGFAWPDQTVRWKHRISLAVSGSIADDQPRADWFRVWRDWKPEDRNLEPSAGHEYAIPCAEPIDVGTLPGALRARLAS